jgi:hypothetical protein
MFLVDCARRQWEQRLATMRALNRRHLTVPHEFGTHNARDAHEKDGRERKVGVVCGVGGHRVTPAHTAMSHLASLNTGMHPAHEWLLVQDQHA